MTFQETHRLHSTEYLVHLEPRAHKKIACVAHDRWARCGVIFFTNLVVGGADATTVCSSPTARTKRVSKNRWPRPRSWCNQGVFSKILWTSRAQLLQAPRAHAVLHLHLQFQQGVWPWFWFFQCVASLPKRKVMAFSISVFCVRKTTTFPWASVPICQSSIQSRSVCNRCPPPPAQCNVSYCGLLPFSISCNLISFGLSRAHRALSNDRRDSVCVSSIPCCRVGPQLGKAIPPRVLPAVQP